jgi:hypothetical protein
MSYLDKAKREAIRMLKLAKSKTGNEGVPTLVIKNLSHAREHLAYMNGYDSWHGYEKALWQKDCIENRPSKKQTLSDSKRALMNVEYFLEDRPYVHYHNSNPLQDKSRDTIMRNAKIEFANYPIKQTLFRSKKLDKQKWILTNNSFPLFMSGTGGSGRSRAMLHMCSSIIANDTGLESLIYFDGKGDLSYYQYLYSECSRYNRLQDLYYLNMSNTINRNPDEDSNEKFSHTIDPINPLIGNEIAFKMLFGDKIGTLLSHICLDVKKADGLVNADSIEQFISLKTLINIRANPMFFDSRHFIDDYFEDIGLHLDGSAPPQEADDAVKKHALNCISAFDVIDTMHCYSNVFSTNPDITMNTVYGMNKILLISFPCMERSMDTVNTLLKFIMLSFKQAKQKNTPAKHAEPFTFFDEFEYLLPIDIFRQVFSQWSQDPSEKNQRQSVDSPYAENNRMIFAGNSLGEVTYEGRKQVHDCIINNAKTVCIMKTEDHVMSKALKLKLFEHGVSKREINVRDIISQGPGSAFVFGAHCNESNQINAYNQKCYGWLKLTYVEPQFTQEISLNNFKM